MPGSPLKIAADRADSASNGAWGLFGRLFPWLVITYMVWFAMYFALERLHGDSSFFLVRVLGDGKFHIVSGRWVIVLIQWPAVLGWWLGLPVKAIVLLWSLASSATLLGAFLFVTRTLRDTNAGIAAVSVHFVGLAHALFCPVFEFYFGAMLVVVFVATFHSQRIIGLSRLLLLSILFILVISSHFMGLVVMLMVLVLERIWTDRRAMGWLLALLALHLCIRLGSLSAYESDAFSAVFMRFQRVGMTWLFLPGRLLAMAIHGATAYPDTLAIALLTAAILIFRKDIHGLVVFLSGLLVLYIVLGLYFPDGTHMVYREILDYPVPVWIVVVLWRRIMVREWHTGPVLVVLCGCFIFRIVQPLQISEAYAERVSWMKDRIAAAHARNIHRGMVLDVPAFQPCDKGQVLQGLDPLQALLISAAEGSDPPAVLVPATADDDVEGFAERWARDLEARGYRWPELRNGRYFHLPEGPFTLLR